MTEYSYFWLDPLVGHGVLQPYSSDVMDDITYLISKYNTISQGVIPGYLNGLASSRPVGTTIRIASGGAIVAGSLYVNTADVDTVLNSDGYYTFVLRKDWATQTVRILARYDAGAYLSPVQTWDTTWDIVIHRVRRSAGVIVEPWEDVRDYVRSNEYGELKLVARIGSKTSKNWDEPGSALIGARQNARVEVGCIEWTGGAATSGNVVVTFPYAFTYDPTAIVTPLNTHGNVNVSVECTTTTLTIYWRSGSAATYTTLLFQWLALGAIDRKY